MLKREYNSFDSLQLTLFVNSLNIYIASDKIFCEFNWFKVS